MLPRILNRICLLMLASMFWLARAAAEEIITRDGKVFKQAEVVRVTAEGLQIKHEGATITVPLKDLSDVLEQRYGAQIREAELKQREEEIERLRKELANAEAEAMRLRQELGKPKREPTPRTAAQTEAAPPLTSLPPFKPGEVIDAHDLVLHYKANPALASQRYDGKVFQMKGVIERFATTLFRQYEVLLESPERLITVRSRFGFLEEYKAVYPAENGRRLVAYLTDQKRVTLLKAGETISFTGRCRGLRNGEIAFSQCELKRADRNNQ